MPLFFRKPARNFEPDGPTAPRLIVLSPMPRPRTRPSPYVISLASRPEPPLPVRRARAGFLGRGIRHGARLTSRAARMAMASFMTLALVVASASVLLSAFEAHVINVTAKIEGCDEFKVRSKGYWKNHEEIWNPALLPQTVGGILVDDLFDGQDIFDTNDTMADRLRAQLLALKFNIASTPEVAHALVPGEDTRISELVEEADALLLEDPPASNAELEDMKDRVKSVNTAHKVSTCPPPEDPCDDRDDDHDWDFSIFGGSNGGDPSTSLVASGGDGGDPSALLGASGGDGGIIITGDACSRVEIENDINTNVTEIDVCEGDCAETESGGGDTTVIIENDNSATVINEVNSEANTGGNTANGGDGGEGGDGGSAGSAGGGEGEPEALSEEPAAPAEEPILEPVGEEPASDEPVVEETPPTPEPEATPTSAESARPAGGAPAGEPPPAETPPPAPVPEPTPPPPPPAAEPPPPSPVSEDA